MSPCDLLVAFGHIDLDGALAMSVHYELRISCWHWMCLTLHRI